MYAIRSYYGILLLTLELQKYRMYEKNYFCPVDQYPGFNDVGTGKGESF